MTLLLDDRPAAGPPAGVPVRVALLGSRGLPAHRDGFETFVAELAPRLAVRGLEVTVFREGAASPERTRVGGVRLELVRPRGPARLRGLSYDIASLWRARGRFDVVVVLGCRASLACRLARGRRSQVWIHMGGAEWRRSRWGPAARRWLRAMEGVAARVSSRLVFDSAALAEEVRARRDVRAFEVIEHGAPVVREADVAPVVERGLEPDGYHLAVTRGEPADRVLDAIRAHRKAWCERPLAIVSEAARPTRYGAELARWRGGDVRFLGPVHDPRVLASLRFHCRAYVHGHGHGGTHPALLEALGSGCFVLAHDDPGNREALGDAGLYFRDELSLRAALEAAERLSPEEQRAFAEAARARVEERHDWERIADRYARLLRSAVAAAGR